ncbi:hypothetical protein [Pseudomonas matsuisoli]|uniref:Uncharacterized protein n=1 Tax=Pseudomonas matsuisoli TaxID=1515666 RepID=A0A917PV01_9PSED|nr:hypothetical protein [Pseudomonas matsuisoli]GGJ93111.1 hypothetical protein GCM10009304_18760 [Pseudomonas matsuisoli]
MRRNDTGLGALARAVEVRPALNVASCQYKVSQNSVLGHQVMGDHPRVTRCGGRQGHAAFTYHLNQITKGTDNLRDHVLSELYNVGSVLRWQLKDATPLHRGVTRYVSP